MIDDEFDLFDGICGIIKLPGVPPDAWRANPLDVESETSYLPLGEEDIVGIKGERDMMDKGKVTGAITERCFVIIWRCV